MPQFYKFLQHPLGRIIFLALLIGGSLIYTIGVRHLLFAPASSQPDSIVEQATLTNPATELNYWTSSAMRNAVNDDLLSDTSSSFAQDNTAQPAAAQQDGQPPANGNGEYPLSTVGKIFFSDTSGRNYVCSGTAIESQNHNTVDTAGHCLYASGSGWMQNVIFCPLYKNGDTPYGCWGASDLAVPSGWMNAKPNDLHEDFGMAVVAPNSEGNLTDVVGGAGWAYDQADSQTFYAYGYPAGAPFNGQTRQSCQGSSRIWNYAGGKVVSIACNMTGGSSGGPWFIQVNGKWYLDGHNDFTSTIQPGHMFSPYYGATWYALYQQAQQD